MNGVAHKALALGAASMQLLFLKESQRSTWWHLAVVPPSIRLSDLREALKRRESKNHDLYDDGTLLAMFGITSQISGDISDLLKFRKELLVEKEKEFVTALGLNWA